MSKPRAFLLDIDDWLGSFTVEEMSGDQVKAYLYLLCRAWHETPIATLPNDDAKLARMARVSPEQWECIKPEILAQFKTNGNGRIYNERLKQEADYCSTKSFAGRAGWTAARRKEQSDRAKKTVARPKRKP